MPAFFESPGTELHCLARLRLTTWSVDRVADCLQALSR
jgi:hypothetical protein